MDLDFLLRPAQICKKCNIYLRTITQEKKNKTWQLTNFFFFFFSTFWTITFCDIHFCILKMSKFISMGTPFGPCWSAKHLTFGYETCEVEFCSVRFRNHTHKKKYVLLFQSNWEPNLSDLMVYVENRIYLARHRFKSQY